MTLCHATAKPLQALQSPALISHKAKGGNFKGLLLEA
jgi:hypothetical protein